VTDSSELHAEWRGVLRTKHPRWGDELLKLRHLLDKLFNIRVVEIEVFCLNVELLKVAEHGKRYYIQSRKAVYPAYLYGFENVLAANEGGRKIHG